MMDKTQIMQMIETIKGSLMELESALGEGEGEADPSMEESPEMGMEAPIEAGTEAGAEPSYEGDEEDMPPMLKKFMGR